MNIPNLLTLSRIFFAVIIVMLLQEKSLSGNVLAVIAFIMASVTDFYDGYLAKAWGLVSDFGKIMDPLADKVLLLSIFGVLVHLHMIAWWMFLVIAIREIGVTIWRLWAMSQGKILAAERGGKIKTVVQIFAVSSILFFLVAHQALSGFSSIGPIWAIINYGLMLLAVFLTVYSGLDYFKNRN